jgi:hypothetical protein
MMPNKEDALKGLQALADLGKRVKNGRLAPSDLQTPSEPQRFEPSEPPKPTIVKPADQVLLPHQIQWNWYLPRTYWVKAIFWKETSGWDIEFGVTDSMQTANIDPEDAKTIAQALLSAIEWQHVWQQHAGEFLTAIFERTEEEPKIGDMVGDPPKPYGGGASA